MTVKVTTKEEADCKSSAEIAKEFCDDIMPKKAKMDFWSILILGIMAGVFIGFASEVATFVTHDSAKYVGKGISKLLAGLVFSTGLIMVVLTGANLFTGSILMSISTFQKKVSVKNLLKNWTMVYFANFIGSLLLVLIIFFSGLHKQHDFMSGAAAIKIAYAKTDLTFVEALMRGILCNWIVCLAIWLAYTSKQVIGKIFAITFPIMIFIASGYEHCVANMYFIPKALMLKSIPEVVAKTGLSPAQINEFTTSSFLLNNLLPVTIGNIIGGALFVSGLFWFVYLRKSDKK